MAPPKDPLRPFPVKDTSILYSDHQKKIYEFATAERTVRSGGVTETLSNVDIMLRKQFEAGVSGKTLAQRDYIRQFQQAEDARRTEIESRCALWSGVKARHQAIIDRAHAAQAPVPRVLPHPDDIIIDWTDGIRLPGPVDETDWKKFDETVRLRDV